MKRIASALLPLVGLALFAWIVWRTGAGAIAGRIASVRALPLCAAMALVPVILVVRGTRWRRILALGGVAWPARRAIGAWSVGFFASAITPAKAGDAIRAWYVRTDTGCSLAAALASVFVDRLFDLLLVVAAGVVSVALFSARYAQLPSSGAMVAVALVVALGAAAATNRRLVRAVARPFVALVVPPSLRESLAGSFHAFYDATARTISSPRAVAEILAWTVVAWALIVALALAVARAFDVGVSAGYLAMTMPIITLVELVPVSVSGVGTRDAAAVYLFGVVGVERAAAVGFSLGYLAVGTWLTALVGFAVWIRNPVSLRAAPGGTGTPGEVAEAAGAGERSGP